MIPSYLIPMLPTGQPRLTFAGVPVVAGPYYVAGQTLYVPEPDSHLHHAGDSLAQCHVAGDVQTHIEPRFRHR